MIDPNLHMYTEEMNMEYEESERKEKMKELKRALKDAKTSAKNQKELADITISELQKELELSRDVGSMADEEINSLMLKLAEVKDIVYALGLDYKKLSDDGKTRYDNLCKVIRVGERNVRE